jgi:hypothetical protein
VKPVWRTPAICVRPLANRGRAIRMDSRAVAKGHRQVSQGSPALNFPAPESENRLSYKGAYAFQTFAGWEYGGIKGELNSQVSTKHLASLRVMACRCEVIVGMEPYTTMEKEASCREQSWRFA